MAISETSKFLETAAKQVDNV